MFNIIKKNQVCFERRNTEYATVSCYVPTWSSRNEPMRLFPSSSYRLKNLNPGWHDFCAFADYSYLIRRIQFTKKNAYTLPGIELRILAKLSTTLTIILG